MAKNIPNIEQSSCIPWIVMWLCLLVGCQDFQDQRTPYKSFVRIHIKPYNKEDKLRTLTIKDKDRVEILEGRAYTDYTYIFDVPLELDRTQRILEINYERETFRMNSSKRLTINYRKQAGLISHQRGCTYKYTLGGIKLTGERDQGRFAYKVINQTLSTFNDSDADIQIFL